MYKKVLVPLDGSALAEGVLRHAQALAQSEGAEIVILRVAANPAAEFAFGDPALAADAVERSESEAKRYMEAEAAKLKQAGYRVSSLLRDGGPADTILKVAEEIGADVIAMSTHGRTGPARWLMGSVADRVVRHSPIPVMLIRPQN